MSVELDAYTAVLSFLDSACDRKDPERIVYWVKEERKTYYKYFVDKRHHTEVQKATALREVITTKHKNIFSRLVKHLLKLGLLRPEDDLNPNWAPVKGVDGADVLRSIFKELEEGQ